MSIAWEDRVYAEHLRLALEGVAQSVAVGFLVSTLMLVVLWDLAPRAALVGWYAAFLVERTTAAVFAWRARRAVS